MLLLSISFCSCILQELNQLVLRKDCSLQLWSLPLILFLLTLLILTVVSFLIYNLFLILGIFFNFLTQLLILYQTKGLPKLPKYFITLDFQNFWNLLCVWNSKKIYLLFIDQRAGLSPKLPWYSLNYFFKRLDLVQNIIRFRFLLAEFIHSSRWHFVYYKGCCCVLRAWKLFLNFCGRMFICKKTKFKVRFKNLRSLVLMQSHSIGKSEKITKVK